MRIVLFLAVLGALLAGGCSKTVDEFTMPNLVGKYWTDAEPQLRGLGWEGELILGGKIPGDPADRNRIVSQDPAAGTKHGKDTAITLTFAR
jgi:eukaryotic-like serine/threonine-protein kinase